MSVQFNLVKRDGTANITVFVNGVMFTADDQHPAFEDIVSAAVDGYGDESLVDLFDVTHKAAAMFENLSERVTVANSRVYVDADEVTGPAADQIIRFLDEEVDDWVPLVAFLEKVYTNVEPHTRENLFRWLDSTGGFTVADNGNIVGYKGLSSERKSIHSGPGIVNGKVFENAHLPNEDGSVVEMARSKVEHDPSVGCSVGLHVGTWEYAKGFGSVVVEVEVNPRDVVSVPTDCGDQKMRVSRYSIVRAVSEPHVEASIPSGFVPAEDYDEDYDAEEEYDWRF